MKLYDASAISHYGHDTYSIYRVLGLTELFGPSIMCSMYTVIRWNKKDQYHNIELQNGVCRNRTDDLLQILTVTIPLS